MTTAQQNASGGGLFSKLVIVILLAATIGLYLMIVVVDDQGGYQGAAPQASIQVVEDQVPAGAPVAHAPRDLPDEQMQLIKQVFAPELLKN